MRRRYPISPLGSESWGGRGVWRYRNSHTVATWKDPIWAVSKRDARTLRSKRCVSYVTRWMWAWGRPFGNRDIPIFIYFRAVARRVLFLGCLGKLSYIYQPNEIRTRCLWIQSIWSSALFWHWPYGTAGAKALSCRYTSAFQVEGGYNEGGKGVATTDLLYLSHQIHRDGWLLLFASYPDHDGLR